MSTIHPHWDTSDTSSDAQPPRAAAASVAQPLPRPVARVRVAVPSGSRRPAAVIGVLAVAALGFFAATRTDFFSAQVTSPTPIIVRITKDAVSPKNFSAQQGQSISWKNADAVTRTLSSDLPTASGGIKALAIPSGATVTVTVSAQASSGSYTYTDDGKNGVVLGKITVLRSVALAGSPSAASSSALSVASVAAVAVAPTVPTASSQATASSAAAGIVLVATPNDGTLHAAAPVVADSTPVIARNPHTVGAGSVSAHLPNGSDALHNGAPLLATAMAPRRVPQTGPEMWILAIVSLSVFAWLTRSALRQAE